VDDLGCGVPLGEVKDRDNSFVSPLESEAASESDWWLASGADLNTSSFGLR